MEDNGHPDQSIWGESSLHQTRGAPDRNGILTPEKVVAGSGRKVWWRCDGDHEYLAAIVKRASGGTGCPFCAGRNTGYGNDLAARYPALAAEWDEERSGGMTPAMVTPGSGRRAWWRCPQGHRYDMVVHKRVNGAGCPYCSGRRAGQGNDLQALRPDLAAEWHPDRNGSTNPADVTPGSNRRVWWRCGQGHDFDAIIVNRAGNGDGCPFCSGQRVGYGNDLASLFPDLAVEWHPVRNGALNPREIRPSSHQSAWWKCRQCGHGWSSVVSTRTAGKGCPECGVRRLSAARRRPLAGRSLANRRPDLVAEWHPDLNGEQTPSTTSAGSGDFVWWRCQHGRTWVAIVSNRSRQHGSRCPSCTLANNSRLEISIFAELRHILGGHLEPARHCPRILPDLGRRSMTVDMLVADIVVEYDSAYWHAAQHATDSAKTAKLTSLGYRVARIREHPLGPLTDHDVLVPARNAAHLTAAATLLSMRQWGWLPHSLAVAANDYASGEEPVAAGIAQRMIQDRLRR